MGQRDLPLADIYKILSLLKKQGIVRLGVTGGEPFLHKDIMSVVSKIREMNFFLTLNSNLSKYSDYHPEITKYVDCFLTSLDGEADVHQKSRGDTGHQLIMENIERISTMGGKVVAIYVLNEKNLELETARKLLERAQKKGFRVFFQLSCYNASITRGPGVSKISSQQLTLFIKHILRWKRMGLPVANTYGAIKALLKWPDFTLEAYREKRGRCGAYYAHVFIDALGDVWPCAYLIDKVNGHNLIQDMQIKCIDNLPCSSCFIGPYLEHAQLLQRPWRNVWELMAVYV